MLLVLSLPVIINTHYILVIWLKLLPPHIVTFVQLSLVFTLCESISNPLITAMLATGNIKKYQIVVGGLQMLNLPISYLFLWMGYMPESVLVVAIFISQSCLAARLYMLRGMIGLSSILFLKKVYLNVIIVTLLSAIVPVLFFMELHEGTLSLILVSLICVLSCCLSIYFVGCSKSERAFVCQKALTVLQKLKK